LSFFLVGLLDCFECFGFFVFLFLFCLFCFVLFVCLFLFVCLLVCLFLFVHYSVCVCFVFVCFGAGSCFCFIDNSAQSLLLTTLFSKLNRVYSDRRTIVEWSFRKFICREVKLDANHADVESTRQLLKDLYHTSGRMIKRSWPEKEE
jgi:hypothetical protein